MTGSEPLKTVAMVTALLALAVALLTPQQAPAAPKRSKCRTTALPWKHMDSFKAPGAPVRVWFDSRYPADKARAKGQAREIGRRIMPAFERVVGSRRPLSDAKVKCRHGGDGRLDVYIVRGKRSELGGDRAAVAVPFTTEEPCLTHAPYLVLLRPKLPRAVLAHELFHVLQATYDRKASCINYLEWDEAMATWAQDFVYPDDQDEHQFKALFDAPDYPLSMDGYGGWTFLRYLTETQGGHVQIRRILEAGERIAPVDHRADNIVDATIPGGFAERLPEFGLYAWNQDPVPTGRISGSLRSWDGFDAVPMVGSSKDRRPTPVVDVALQGQSQRTDTLQRGPAGMFLLGREYHHLRFEDQAVRHVEVRNRWRGVPGAHVTGFVRIGSRWEVVDWTGEETKTFCRDQPDQDVREMVLVLSNHSYLDRIDAPRPEVVSSDSCGLTVQVTAYRETLRAQTDLGWSSKDHHLVAPAPPSRVVILGPDDDRPDYDSHQAVCERGETCRLNLYATTKNTTDGVIDGPNHADDPCPYSYGIRTFGPFEDIAIGSMEIDLTGPEPTAVLVDGVGPLEVGDSTENMCSGRSRAAVLDDIRTPVSWDDLQSGKPVTVSWDSSGVKPTDPSSASATISWAYGTTITLQRVTG